MKDQLVSFEVAKLAKEKGFGWSTDQMYSGIMNIPQPERYNETKWRLYHDYCLAPTQTMLQTWLRNVHDIHVYANHYEFAVDSGNGYYYHIGKSVRNANLSYVGKFETYEQALEQGLYEALKLIS